MIEDTAECLTEREIDLSLVALDPEALEEVCTSVEARASELGIQVVWTHRKPEDGDPEGEPEAANEADSEAVSGVA